MEWLKAVLRLAPWTTLALSLSIPVREKERRTLRPLTEKNPQIFPLENKGSRITTHEEKQGRHHNVGTPKEFGGPGVVHVLACGEWAHC